MTENRLKIVVGLFVIFSQLGVFISILSLYAVGGFLFDEMTTSIALVMPMFSIYTAAIVKYILANRHVTNDTSSNVTVSYIIISLSLPILLVVLLEISVFFKAYNIAFSSFEQFKTTLTILESLFGLYLGLILSSMFEIKKKENA